MTEEKSSFATCLDELLKAKVGFNYARWASYLGVSRPTVTHWISDTHVPSPERLITILHQFSNPTLAESAALEAFYEMADRPITEVSRDPNKFRHAASVSDYIFEFSLSLAAIKSKDLPIPVRLETLSFFAAMVQVLDAHFMTSGKNKKAKVFAIVENLQQKRLSATSFDFLFEEHSPVTQEYEFVPVVSSKPKREKSKPVVSIANDRSSSKNLASPRR